MYEETLEKVALAGNLRNLSPSSVEGYCANLTHFFNFVGKDPALIEMEDVFAFVLSKKQKGLKATSINNYHAAIRFYFRYVLHTPWDEDLVPKMIKDYYLPTVLSREQIELLIESADCLKHKAMIALMYSSGLRVSELLDLCYKKDWVPYCKKTFNGAQSVIKYLGKYTHRIAISNHRIISIDENTVTFYVKDYKNEGHWEKLTLSGIEFIRRFLMHVPPKRFVRIRHFGLLCNRSKKENLTICRNLLGCKQYLSQLRDMDSAQMIEHLWNVKINICKHCGGHIFDHHRQRPMLC